MSRPAVLETPPSEWMAEAIDYIATRARTVGTVTAEDLRRDLPAPHHHNQYGSAFRTAAARHLIQMVDGGRSTARSRHGGHRGVWALHPEQLRGAHP